MKKFNLVLLVLVAALFGSSLVACANSASGSFDFETPAESYVTATFIDDRTVATFRPFPGCSTVNEIEAQLRANVTYVLGPLNSEDLEDLFGDYEGIVNGILNNDLYHNNDYIVLIYGNVNELYKLEITDGAIVLINVPNPDPDLESAVE